MNKKNKATADLITQLQVLRELSSLPGGEFWLQKQVLMDSIKKRLQKFIESYEEADNDL